MSVEGGRYYLPGEAPLEADLVSPELAWDYSQAGGGYYFEPAYPSPNLHGHHQSQPPAHSGHSQPYALSAQTTSERERPPTHSTNLAPSSGPFPGTSGPFEPVAPHLAASRSLSESFVAPYRPIAPESLLAVQPPSCSPSRKSSSESYHYSASPSPGAPQSRKQSRGPSHNHRRSKTTSGIADRSRAKDAAASLAGFVNYTPEDSLTILGGVAPSGSSKTKARREKEAADKRRRLSQAAAKAVLDAGGDVEELRKCGLL